MTRLAKGRIARMAVILVAIALGTMFTVACTVHGVGELGTLSTLTISPNPQVLAVNATHRFSVAGTDFSSADVSITPNWSVVNGGGSIDPTTGVFTAGAVAGTFRNTVKATSGTLSALATVSVTAIAPSLATITVTPTPISMPANQRPKQIVANLRLDRQGSMGFRGTKQ